MKRAEDAADALADRLGLDGPEHLDLELIAAHLGVFVRYADLADEEASLLRSPGISVVTMAQRIRGSHKSRFVLAHELGHLLLHPSLDDFARCTGIGTRGSSGRHEVEASAFAAAFLLSRRTFGPCCRAERPTLEDVSGLADRFQVSLTTTAIRFVGLAKAPCAIVSSRAGKVAWVKRSASFVPHVARGTAVGGAAYARLLFAGERAPGRMLSVDGAAWGAGSEVDLHEHSRSDGAGGVLSWLWHAG